MTIKDIMIVTGKNIDNYNKYLLDNYTVEEVEVILGNDRLHKYVWLEWYSCGKWNIDEEVDKYVYG